MSTQVAVASNITAYSTGNNVSHETEPLYLWLQGIYGYMDLFLLQLRFILSLVLCGVSEVVRAVSYT